MQFKYLNCINQLMVLISIVQKVNSESDDLPLKPESCHRPPNFMYRQCCIFPPFFTREVAKECGGIFSVVKNNQVTKYNVTIMIRAADADELHWKCVLNKYKLLSPDNMLLEEKYFAHLDKWAEFNPKFTNVIRDAKKECKLYYGVYFPLDLKEFFKLNGCVRNYVNVYCPDVIRTKECDEQKKFYEDCGKYFV